MVDLVVARYEKFFRDSRRESLMKGDRSAACSNIRWAVEVLGHHIPEPSGNEVFDDALEQEVSALQSELGHRVSDGRVGPGTRKLLVKELVSRFLPQIFQRLPQHPKPSIFLSYARGDGAKVHKLRQWLIDRGVWVRYDEEAFEAGKGIDANIRRAVAEADRVLVAFSKNSKNRDWPRVEANIAEQLEALIGEAVLIYVRLDNSPLPAHDPNRVAIDSVGVPLKEVGARVLHAIGGQPVKSRRVEYDEDEPL
jgi:AcrR family transcriptional regulator